MKAVILAAGEGKRLRPLTHTAPKAMLYVAGKPILHHLVLELKKVNISEIIIVVKYLKERIIEYFENKENKEGVKIEFVEQGEEYGTGAALLTAKGRLKEKFVLIAGDTLLDSSIISETIKNHEKGITLAVKKVKNPHNYGVVEVDGGKVKGLEEKPEKPKTDLVNLSVYVFDSDIFEKLDELKKSERGEIEITDLLIGAKAVETKGFWMDIAYPWQLFDANDYLLENMEMSTERGNIKDSTIKGKVILEKGAKIINSYIEGNSYIGKDTVIGPNAYLRGNNSIGENCSIGGGSTIKNCILGNNVNAKHLAYLGDSVIGNNINFGSGSQLANYRFDAKPISVLTEKGWVNTGRKKMGCVIGDDTKLGVLSCVMPGKLIGNNCWISSGLVVNKNVFSNTKVFLKQEHIFMKQGSEEEEKK